MSIFSSTNSSGDSKELVLNLYQFLYIILLLYGTHGGVRGFFGRLLLGVAQLGPAGPKPLLRELVLGAKVVLYRAILKQRGLKLTTLGKKRKKKCSDIVLYTVLSCGDEPVYIYMYKQWRFFMDNLMFDVQLANVLTR